MMLTVDSNRLFPLDPNLIYLNHGAFGVTPHDVLNEKRRILYEIEKNPVDFLQFKISERWQQIANTVAKRFLCNENSVAIVDNATDRAVAILRALSLKPDEEILITQWDYHAVALATRHSSRNRGGKVVEVFDARGVSFVAVTQQFNTTTSMGRLTLNVLLSFAQFEREVTGERIRDKIAASKQKGMWMGGLVPIGYDVVDRRLVVNQTEAETVREIFNRYMELGSVRLLTEDLNRRGIRSKERVAKNGKRSGGNLFFRGALYELLSNPIYIGEIRHKGVRHPGLHEPIVERELWENTQLLRRTHSAQRSTRMRKSSASPLTGKLFDDSGQSLTPSHAVKGERRYRYYVSRNLINGTSNSGPRGWRVPAPEIERTVASAASTILSDEAVIANAALAIGLAEHQL